MSGDIPGMAETDRINWKRWLYMGIGIFLFVVVYIAPPWPDAVDPGGKHFLLSREGKGALAIFLLAGTWWVFEVLPIGITSIAIGVLQTLFLIRPADKAIQEFHGPVGHVHFRIHHDRAGFHQNRADQTIGL